MRKITRRNFLKAAGLCASLAALTACGSAAASGSSVSASDSESESASASGDAGSEYEGDLSDIIPKDTVTLTVYDQLSNYSGEQIGWFAKMLLDKFNVKLNIIPDTDGAYQTRMESGDLGDLVLWGNSTDQYLGAVDKGMLLDWNEDDVLADYGPYIAAHMSSALDKNKNLSGGTVYGFGYDVGVNLTDLTGFTYTWGTRWDLYKQMGYPTVDTLDDFCDLLIKMHELCPTDDNGNKACAVSLFNDWDGAMVMFVKAMVSAYYGYDEFGIGFYDCKAQQYIPAVAKDSPYIEALKFYNKLYQAGALDPDSETQKYDGSTEDYRVGAALFNPFSFLGPDQYNTDEHTAAGKAMYPVVPTQAAPINYGQNIYGWERVWTIGANTEYPELCMAIINWLCTPEGKLDDLYGPKDVCWYYDDQGYTCFTDLGKACKADSSTQMTGDYTGAFKDGTDQLNLTTWAIDAKNPDSNGEDYNCTHWKSNKAEASSDIEKDWRDKVGSDSVDDYLASRNYVVAPGTTYTASAKSDELTVTWNQVTDAVKTYSWKAMMAASDSEFDSVVAEMLDKTASYGLADCDAFQQNEATLRKAAEDAALNVK